MFVDINAWNVRTVLASHMAHAKLQSFVIIVDTLNCVCLHVAAGSDIVITIVTYLSLTCSSLLTWKQKELTKRIYTPLLMITIMSLFLSLNHLVMLLSKSL